MIQLNSKRWSRNLIRAKSTPFSKTTLLQSEPFFTMFILSTAPDYSIPRKVLLTIVLSNYQVNTQCTLPLRMKGFVQKTQQKARHTRLTVGADRICKKNLCYFYRVISQNLLSTYLGHSMSDQRTFLPHVFRF